MGKELFRESDKSTALAGVQFTAGTASDIRQNAHLPIVNSRLYDPTVGRYAPVPFGVLDPRLGICQAKNVCETCNQNQENCVGHFGFINLEYPVFHIGFFRLTIQVLQCICKRCAGTLMQGPEKMKLHRAVGALRMDDYLKRKALHKKIVALSKKISICPHCGYTNGVVKKAVGAVFKIVHAEPIKAEEVVNFAASQKDEREVQNLLTNTKFALMDPLRVFKLFMNISKADIPFLMVQTESVKHPTTLLITRMPVPPVVIRPSVISDTRAGSNEDDITAKLSEILIYNEVLKKHKHDGMPMKSIFEAWEMLQIQCALYINSEINGLPPEIQPKKFVRSFAQRLKGKQGRFRGNLSGKRVDFSGRTVISPDPNLKVDQVGVPLLMAKTLTFPEYVNGINIEKMRALVRNGESIHPGANHIIDRVTGQKRSLKYSNLQQAAQNLKFGDIVERHLRDDDIVLFNRQPSLHRVSIMSHRVKVMPYKTLRFNECACTPYNADFDGDEMNIHVPQTYEARAEASLLMSIKSNLITPRSGEPLVAAIQDFITAAYLLTHRDTFLTRDDVYRIAAALIDVNAKSQQRIRVPPPAIISPVRMWTGKQLVELIIAPESDTKVRVNLNTPNKSHPKELDEFSKGADTYVIIRNNQLLTGMIDKALLGSSSKTNIFYILLRDFGEDYALEAMWRLARMSPVYLSNRGFSIGIGDVTPSLGLIRDKQKLLDNGYGQCEEFIEELRIGKLKARPGQTHAGTLESLILRELSQIRDHAGRACVHNLSRNNTPLTMAICGSKGSYINISQMIACVGQQSISGHRPSEGFEFRCLPMFERHDKSPVARGFVENSFYSGLTPTEFFYHTMAGREGLVDTAVKTAETGYMQRRLVKCLEDLTVSYDSTVRTSTGEIVQFRFGEDGLDPCVMEAKDGSVVDYAHILAHVRNTTPFDAVPAIKKSASPVKGRAAGTRAANVPDVTKMSKADMDKYIENAIEQAGMRSLHNQFSNQLFEYLSKHQGKTRKWADHACSEHADATPAVRKKCPSCKLKAAHWPTLMRAHHLSCAQITAFVDMCAEKLRKAVVEPGTAVGAISATSIGEPSTQMTLKTFHFAGVASMNITEGVPRIKEIINAVRHISTPVITVELNNNQDEKLARRVKSRIEKTTLGEISEYIEQVFLPSDSFVLVKLSARRIRLLQLEVTMQTIISSIVTHKFPIAMKKCAIQPAGKTMILVRMPDEDEVPVSLALHYLKYMLANVVIKGLPHVSRCIIHADEKKGDTYKLLVEGTDFREVLAIYEVEPRKTSFNNANVTAEILGIEAARSSIISEIIATMQSHGIDLDRRHVMLLADLMTYRGEVLGITRNGLAKMKESVLLLASFERTTDHLFEAAFYGQEDALVGVSESIIMGTQANIGTGMLRLLQKRTKLPKLASLQKTSIFEAPSLQLKI